MFHTGSFDRTADVIVLGFGDAGATAALTAHAEGADVLIVDKQPREGRRPNSRYAAGYFVVPEDVDGATEYLTDLYRVNGEHHDMDPAMIRVWAEETAATPEWWRGQGGLSRRVAVGGEHTTAARSGSLEVHQAQHPEGGQVLGCPVFTLLDQRVEEEGIAVLHEAAAEWLLTDSAGRVVGVQVRQHGALLRLGARRGVVLALGGFEFNEVLKRQHLPTSPTHFYGSTSSTGDGVAMALDVGARLWHMSTHPGALVAHAPGSGYPGGLPVDLWGTSKDEPAGGILVDQAGSRFTRETNRQHTMHLEVGALDALRLTHPRIPVWWIFDERRRTAGPVIRSQNGPAGPVGDVRWSADNLVEIDRGWIVSAGSLAELADACRLDADRLAATVTTYNAACATGEDAVFGREQRTLVPIAEPPFHAMALWPGGSNTSGGAVRDPDARVQSVRGHPIDGLYSAGEFGSMYGLLYPGGGGSIAECLAFGRIAGRAAAQRD